MVRFTEQRRRKAQKKKERVEIREDDEEEDMSVPVLEQEELKSNVVAQTVVTSQHLSDSVWIATNIVVVRRQSFASGKQPTHGTLKTKQSHSIAAT